MAAAMWVLGLLFCLMVIGFCAVLSGAWTWVLTAAVYGGVFAVILIVGWQGRGGSSE